MQYEGPGHEHLRRIQHCWVGVVQGLNVQTKALRIKKISNEGIAAIPAYGSLDWHEPHCKLKQSLVQDFGP